MDVISTQRKKQSNTINYLRAAAIIMVVIQHALSYALKSFGEDNAIYSGMISVINSVNVPLFFMISGYLCHQQNVLKYYKKKVFQLFVPFFVFTTAKVVVNLASGLFTHADSLGGELAIAYLNGDYYWFSYCLLVMLLIAPLLWKLKNKVVLVTSFLLLLAFNIANGYFSFFKQGGPFQIFSVLIYGVWFFFGYVLQQLNAQDLLKKKFVKHIAFLLSIAVSSAVIYLSANDMINSFVRKLILSVSLSYVLLYIFSLIPFQMPLLNYVSKYSYQIFFLDSFVKVVLFAVASKFLSLNLPVVLLLALANIVISTIISYIAHKIKIVNRLFGLS